MQIPESDVYWPYSLLKVSENKSTARTGVQPGSAHELVGVNGASEGGIEPFPGFREMHRFRMDTATGWSGSNPYATAAHRSKVVDFWSFSVIAGADKRVWGFVYVARRPNDLSTPACVNTYDILLEYRAPQNTGGIADVQWKTVVIRENVNGGILADRGNNSAGGAIMSLETTGKALYLFERGQAPVAIYFRYTASPQTTVAEIVSPAGPGIVPGSRMFTNTSGAEVDFPTSAGSAHDVAWFPDPTNSANPPGSVVFCRIASGTTPAAGTGGGGPFAVSNLSTAPALEEGSYTLAVQFEDSLSGRKSQLSTNVDFTFAGGGRQVFVDGIFNKNRFDTLNIYRSVKTQNAAGVYTGGILQLDAKVTLSSYEVTDLPLRSGSLPSGAGIGYFRYAYQLKDASLVMQDVFLDRPRYFQTMPKGGAGAILDGSMLVGNISEGAADLTGTGETRWSSSTEDSPELFTEKGQYRPSNVGDAVTCFKRTGQVMTGLTRSGIYFFNKDGGFIRVTPGHQGFGVVGPYAAASVGPVTYFMNYRGLKAVFTDGKLDDVQAIDDLVSEEWYSGTTGAQELSKVSMAFDPATLCLYILNPTRQTAVQMWFSTGVVSELQDMSFGKVTGGWWEDTDGQLVPRALFVLNAPFPDAVTNTAFRPGVFMPSRTYGDKTYLETNSNGVYMFDAECQHANQQDNLKVTAENYANYDSTCTQQSYTGTAITDFGSTQNPFTSSNTVAARMIGSWVYNATVKGVGRRSRVVDSTGARLLVADSNYSIGYLVFDPIYMRWVGAPLRMTEDGSEEFVVKHPTSMGAVFSDVETTAFKSSPIRVWTGLLYKANDQDPYFEVSPVDTSGSLVTLSVVDGDTPSWAAFGKHSLRGQWFSPGVEIYVSNVRYRLIGVQVKGRMLSTDRTRRTY